MALWDLLKQAPIAAIGRAVQGYFQPQQSQPANTMTQEQFQQKYTTAPNQGVSMSDLQKGIQSGGLRVDSAAPGGSFQQSGGGSSGGGGDQPPYAPNVVNQTVSYGGRTWKGNPGSGWTMVGESSPQTQAPVAPAAPPKFDMGAFSRKMADMASSASQKFSAGLGAAGEAVKAGGSNLMSAIGRSVQPMPNFKVGAADENAPEQKKSPGWYGLNTATKGTWNPFGVNLKDVGITEGIAKMFGGKGSTEPTNLYNPKQAQVGQIGEKGYGTFSSTPAELPTTPPALGGGGGGGGGQINFSNDPDLNQALYEALMAPATQIDVGEMQDLDASVQQISSEMGIPEAQAAQQVVNKEIMVIGDDIEAVEADVNELKGDTLMTEGQRRRLIEARVRPLREQLSKLVRSAQYLGVNMQNLMSMLSQRMEAKKATMTSQFQAAQMNQNAEEERKRRLLGLLPYVQPKAKAVSSGGGGGSGGGDIFEQAKALGLEV